jgi:hypothetical protein
VREKERERGKNNWKTKIKLKEIKGKKVSKEKLGIL